VAKRSPILGYNHNVRYRGLVFHVQTEDSGLLSPHLFTHMFHGGVIISTRKLVYDAGSAEDSIKSLMQAQHKAVLKDLKKGTFDDKIDQYLGGTPGLLPRGTQDDNDDSQLRPSEAMIDTQPLPQPARVEPASSRQATEADISAFDPSQRPTRTKTAERGSAPSTVRTNLPPPPSDDLDGPTFNRNDAEGIAAAIAAANAAGPPYPSDATVPNEMLTELSPLEIELELDEPDELPPRRARDTAIEHPIELDTPKRMPGDAVPPIPVPNAHPRAPSSVGAAALPPKPRIPSRPAISPPQVVSRPLTATGERPRQNGDSDAIEVYAPPPPGAEPPPGVGERPGQYSQHKRGISQKVPIIETFKDRTASGAVAVPPGLARPGRISSQPSSGVPKPVPAPPSIPSTQPKTSTRESGAAPIVQAVPREQSSGVPKPRTTTPQRLTPAPPASRTASSSSGVVMTRPAVIVGAPAKPNQPARVRKAREDEGRGFGQGLISEKSLDEVILAYLSEDADEK
jgi:hypothetical protein